MTALFHFVRTIEIEVNSTCIQWKIHPKPKQFVPIDSIIIYEDYISSNIYSTRHRHKSTNNMCLKIDSKFKLDGIILQLITEIHSKFKSLYFLNTQKNYDRIKSVFMDYLSLTLNINSYLNKDYVPKKTINELNVNTFYWNWQGVSNSNSINVNITDKEIILSVQTNCCQMYNLKENNIIKTYIDVDNIIKIFNVYYDDYEQAGSQPSTFGSNIIIDKFGNIYEYIDVNRGQNAMTHKIVKFIQLNEKKDTLLNDIIIDCINKLEPFSFMYSCDYYKSLKHTFITMLELLINFNNSISKTNPTPIGEDIKTLNEESSNVLDDSVKKKKKIVRIFKPLIKFEGDIKVILPSESEIKIKQISIIIDKFGNITYDTNLDKHIISENFEIKQISKVVLNDIIVDILNEIYEKFKFLYFLKNACQNKKLFSF